MHCICACVSEAGPVRAKNQDAVLIRQTSMDDGKQVLLAAVCDGVGGLMLGELASAHTVRRLSGWFDKVLIPIAARGEAEFLMLGCAWEEVIQHIDFELREFAREQGISLGTTLTAVLILGDHYLLTQVGDSRCYRVSGAAELLTHDQVKEGTHVLLQCVGGSHFLHPWIQSGYLTGREESWILCSDGFWHFTSLEELRDQFSPDRCRDPILLTEQLEKLCQELILRGETDNLSAAIVCFSSHDGPSGQNREQSSDDRQLRGVLQRDEGRD